MVVTPRLLCVIVARLGALATLAHGVDDTGREERA